MQKIAFCLLLLAFSAFAEIQITDEYQLSISPSAIHFDNVQVGGIKTETVYITNVADVPLVMQGVGGGPTGPFSSTQNCQDITLQPGESCESEFVFSPTTAGVVQGVSEGTWNGQPFSIALTGNAISFLSISPSSVNFTNVQVGSTVEQLVYITNVADIPVIMSGVGGAATGPFNTSQNCQDNTLQSGESCAMTFTFSPIGTGEVSGVAVGTWNGQSFSIPVTGNAINELSIAPSTIDFGTVKVGSSNKRIVYITNTGDATVVMSGVGGGPSGPFESTQNCQDISVKAGENCQQEFTFNPNVTGNARGVAQGTWNGQAFKIELSATVEQ